MMGDVELLLPVRRRLRRGPPCKFGVRMCILLLLEGGAPILKGRSEKGKDKVITKGIFEGVGFETRAVE